MTDTTAPHTDGGMVETLERAEAAYFERFLSQPLESVRAALGVRTGAFAGGVITSMSADRTDYWSKAIGIGFVNPIDDAVLAEAREFFDGAGQAGALAIAPMQLPPDWADLSARHGLIPTSPHMKLACSATDFRSGGETDLKVRRLEVADAPAWNEIIRQAFEMKDPDLTPFLAAALEDPTVQVYGAWDKTQLVGAGAVYLLGEVASLNTGATLPAHRRRGVQAALITARASCARAFGCELLTAETGAPENNPSFRNLLRSGFAPQYQRYDWRWADREAEGLTETHVENHMHVSGHSDIDMSF